MGRGGTGLDRRAFLKGVGAAAVGMSTAGSLLGSLPAWASPRPRGGGVLVRRNAKDLTAQQVQDFVNAILALKTTPAPFVEGLSWYDQFVWWHKRAFDCEISAAHMQPSFLPWHRQYLLMFEAALQTVSGDPTMTIPYWDWPDEAATAAIFSPSFMGGQGDAGARWAVTDGPFARGSFALNVLDPRSNDPLRKRYLVRRFGTSLAPELPNQAQVQYCLDRPKYDVEPYSPGSDVTRSFRNYLEGWKNFEGMTCTKGLMDPVPGQGAKSIMHNGVHLWVGGVWKFAGKDYAGTMTLNTSCNDPVFWLHHCNIDRLWSEWEPTHGYDYAPVTGGMMGQNLNDDMWPYRDIGITTTIADLLDISTLGYTYV